MAAHDQNFRTGGAYDTAGKAPFMYFSDQELINTGYVNNSLEGILFDSADGQLILNSQAFYPKWKFFDTNPDSEIYTISSVSITGSTCTITTSISHSLAVGDVVSITGVDWNSTHPFVNGTWVVSDLPAVNQFSYELNTVFDTPISGFTFGWNSATVIKGPVFQIRDDRATTDPKGLSFTSTLFTPLTLLNTPATGRIRVLPSDLYCRFRFQTGSDSSPAGGINSNLFSVVNNAGLNIKPVLWAYFLGYSSSSLGASATIFENAFNSYAIVLRPTGDGSRLQFALVKFAWGVIPSNTWMSTKIDSYLNKFTAEDGTELGYLIATNSSVVNSNVTEIAVSDSFTYDSDFPAKFNLKITIRKHLLSDSDLDRTYLVNLMTNSTYDDFGPGKHYDSILHGYISRPSPNTITTAGILQAYDIQLAPMLYFKFNNVNESYVGEPNLVVSPPNPGSSKIVLDSFFYRQINSNTSTSYLY